MKTHRAYLSLGEPEAGWLPTTFRHQDFELEFNASNVPTDPIEQLSSTLIQLSRGSNYSDRVVWHLEPFCYYFQLQKSGETYRLLISESATYEGSDTLIKEIEGDFDSLILPLYRGLKKFWSQGTTLPGWAAPDATRIQILTDLIKGKK
ncbi:MAG: hypothetical protein AAFV07_12175 [Bacteroidota bacterium]